MARLSCFDRAPKSDWVANLGEQFNHRNRRHSNRLRILADEWDNIVAVALRLGYKPQWFPPEYRQTVEEMLSGVMRGCLPRVEPPEPSSTGPVLGQR